jgi:predicted nucleotide-binding protein
LTLERYIELVKEDIQASPVPFFVPPDAGTQDVEGGWPEPAPRLVPGPIAEVKGTGPGEAATVQRMNPARAIEQLKALRADADTDAVQRDGPAHDEWKAKVRVVMQRALGKDSTVLQSFEDVNYFVGVSSGAPGEDERDRQYFAERVGNAAAYIDAAIYELELDLEPETVTAMPPAPESGVGQIFIVHGHDDGLKETVARLLARTTGREPVILHEHPDAGKTIIEKFELHASQAVFAVVLLTPDDEGRAARQTDAKPSARARQNVILELGYFLGRLGRPRVVALYRAGVELPSDLAGILYKQVDDGGAWRVELLKELRAADVEVDMNRV